MNLSEFFAANGGPVLFNVDGLGEPLYCRLISMDELSKLIRDNKDDGFGLTVKMLALCVVDSTGKPLKSEQQWREVPAANRKTLEAIGREVQRINGLIAAEELTDLGKPSPPTGA